MLLKTPLQYFDITNLDSSRTQVVHLLRLKTCFVLLIIAIRFAAAGSAKLEPSLGQHQPVIFSLAELISLND